MTDEGLSIKEYYSSTIIAQKLIEKRFLEFSEENKPAKMIERNILLTFIDYLLKWKRNDEVFVNNVMEICRQNGYIPQYDVSGSEAIRPNTIECPGKGDFLICKNEKQYDLVITSDMRGIFSIICDGSNNPTRRYCISSDSEMIAASFLIEDEIVLFLIRIRELRVIDYFKIDDAPLTVSNDGSSVAFVLNGTITIRKDCESKSIIPMNGKIIYMGFDNEGKHLIICGSKTTIVDFEEMKIIDVDLVCSPDCMSFFKDGMFHLLTGGHLYSISCNGNLTHIKDLSEAIEPPYQFNNQANLMRNEDATYTFSVNDELYYNLDINYESIKPISYRCDSGKKEADDDPHPNAIDWDFYENPLDRLIHSDECYTVMHNGSSTEVRRYLVAKRTEDYIKVIVQRSTLDRDIGPIFEVLISPDSLKVDSTSNTPEENLDWSASEHIFLSDGTEAYLAFEHHTSECSIDEVIVDSFTRILKREWICDDQGNCLEAGLCNFGGKLHVYCSNSKNAKILPYNDLKKLSNGYTIITSDSSTSCLLADGSIVPIPPGVHGRPEAILNSTMIISDSISSTSVRDGKIVCKTLPANICYLIDEHHAITVDKLGISVVSIDDGSITSRWKYCTGEKWHILEIADSREFTLISYTVNNEKIHFKLATLRTDGILKERDDVQIVINTPPFLHRYKESIDPSLLLNPKLFIAANGQNIYTMERGDMIYYRISKQKITKDGLSAPRNVLKAAVTRYNSTPRYLDGKLYAMVSTGTDDDQSKGFRPEIRIIDSDLGTKTWKEKNTSGGQLYGPRLFEMNDISSMRPLKKGEYIIAEVRNRSKQNVYSWNSKTGNRYPTNPEPTVRYQKILDSYNDGAYILSKVLDKNYLDTVDHKMKILKRERMFLHHETSGDFFQLPPVDCFRKYGMIAADSDVFFEIKEERSVERTSLPIPYGCQNGEQMLEVTLDIFHCVFGVPHDRLSTKLIVPSGMATSMMIPEIYSATYNGGKYSISFITASSDLPMEQKICSIILDPNGECSIIENIHNPFDTQIMTASAVTLSPKGEPTYIMDEGPTLVMNDRSMVIPNGLEDYIPVYADEDISLLRPPYNDGKLAITDWKTIEMMDFLKEEFVVKCRKDKGILIQTIRSKYLVSMDGMETIDESKDKIINKGSIITIGGVYVLNTR